MIVRYLLTSVVSLLFCTIVAQQPVQERISSAGGNYVSSGVSLNWSLGATLVPTLRSDEGNLVLTHGFQEKITVAPIEEKIVLKTGIVVYPNPAVETINIRFPQVPGGRVGIVITDNEGRVVITEQAEGYDDVMEIDLRTLSQGMYFLHLNYGNNTNIYKVVKL